MKTLTAKIIVIAAGFTGMSALSSAQTAAPAAAHWAGTIHMEKRELAVVIDLAKNHAGAWIGSLSIPGSTTVDTPLEAVAVDGASVRFSARVPVVATFSGSLSADGSSLAGVAANAEGETSFQLTRTGEPNVKLPPPSSRLPKAFARNWVGTTEADGKTKHVGLRLTPGPDGVAQAMLIAIDHDNLEIPITTVTIQDRQLQFESRAISGSFRGMLGDNGEITGEWSEATKRLPLTFRQKPAEAPKP